MTEEGGAQIRGHVYVECRSGLTVADLRMLLDGADKAGFPDTAELHARTMWKVNDHGFKVKKLTAVVPE